MYSVCYSRVSPRQTVTRHIIVTSRANADAIIERWNNLGKTGDYRYEIQSFKPAEPDLLDQANWIKTDIGIAT